MDPVTLAIARAGRYQVRGGGYAPVPLSTEATTTGINGVLNEQLALVPFAVPAPIGFDRVGVNVTVAGEASCALHLGLYRTTLPASGNLTHALVEDFGTVAGDAVAFAERTIDITLAPGYYSAAVLLTGAPTTRPTLSIIQGNPHFFGALNTSIATRRTGLGSNSGTFTALPESLAIGQNFLQVVPVTWWRRGA